eukprot:1312109-Pleurochrysis_carterae.AAC.1
MHAACFAERAQSRVQRACAYQCREFPGSCAQGALRECHARRPRAFDLCTQLGHQPDGGVVCEPGPPRGSVGVAVVRRVLNRPPGCRRLGRRHELRCECDQSVVLVH